MSMSVQRVGGIESSPTRQIFLDMWREKMSASARLQKLVRENSPAEQIAQDRRQLKVEPAARIEISKEAKRLTVNG